MLAFEKWGKNMILIVIIGIFGFNKLKPKFILWNS